MKNRSPFVVYNLKETYYDYGLYDFKIVLDSKFYKNGHGLSFELRDSSGSLMKYSAEIWGRKVNCKFVFDESVSDGVCHGVLTSPDQKVICKVNFWIVRP
jgi:hypothetical protein